MPKPDDDDNSDGDRNSTVDDTLTTQPQQGSTHSGDGGDSYDDSTITTSINPRGTRQELVVETNHRAPPDKNDFTGQRVGEVVWTECTVTGSFHPQMRQGTIR